MKSSSCSRCAGSRVIVREIELRKINVRNMALASRQNVIEIECLDCELIDVLETVAAAAALV